MQIETLLRGRYPFWDSLTEAQRDELCACSELLSYPAGSQVFRSTEACMGVMTVLRGAIRIYLPSEDGREVTLFTERAGEVCTLSASCVMDEITFELSIEAVEDTELLVTPAPFLRRLMRENLYVENYIYKQAAERFSAIMDAFHGVLFERLDKRLAALLLDEAGAGESVRATHGQLAQQLNTAREVVSRSLKAFERAGWVALGRGSIVLRDRAALRRAAGR